MMDHAYIDEHNVVARYEMGKLSTAESASFEEHFVDCAQCQEQLTVAENFRQGLRAAVAQNSDLMEPGDSSVTATSPPWRWAIWGAAASLALLSVPAFLLVRETRNLNSELNRANNQAETLQHSYQAEHAANRELQKQLATAGQPSQSAPGSSDSGG